MIKPIPNPSNGSPVKKHGNDPDMIGVLFLAIALATIYIFFIN